MNNIKFNFKCLRSKKISYLYFIIFFLYPAFVNSTIIKYTGSIWVNNEKWIWNRFITQQIGFSFGIILIVLLLVDEKFIEIDSSYLRIHMENRKRYMNSLVYVLFITISGCYAAGEILFAMINYIITRLWVIRWSNLLMACLEILILVLIANSFCLLIQRNPLSIMLYVFTLLACMLLNSEFFTIPLTMGVLKNSIENGFTTVVWWGKISVMGASWVCFIAIRNRYLSNGTVEKIRKTKLTNS